MKRVHVLLLLLALSPPALAAGWEDAERAVDAAVDSGDRRDRARALAWLAYFDHAAAVRAALRLYAAEGARAEEYAKLLRRMRSPRSTRTLVEVAVDGDAAPADLAAAALAGRPDLHLAGEELRHAYRAALKAGDAAAAGRLLPLLAGRLSVLDRKWVREAATDERAPADLRAALLEAYPDHRLRREIAATDELDAIVGGAARIEEALGEDPVDPARLEETLAGLSLAHPAESLAVVYADRVEALLDAKPLRWLRRLNDLSAEIRLARDWNRDRLLHGRDTKERFDRKLATDRMAARAPTVDFAEPGVARRVDDLLAIETLLSALAGGRPVVGPPWHPDLLRLNRGRAGGIDVIAFDPVERERLDLRDAVLSVNRSFPGVTDLERENVRLVNAYRHELGLLPLRLDQDLVTAARAHSRFQARMGDISHDFGPGVEPEGRTPRHRIANAGYPKEHVGRENVLVGTRDPAGAFDWWRNSPGHRANMLDPAFTEIGVGEVATYWTQNFGTEPYDEDHHR